MRVNATPTARHPSAATNGSSQARVAAPSPMAIRPTARTPARSTAITVRTNRSRQVFGRTGTPPSSWRAPRGRGRCPLRRRATVPIGVFTSSAPVTRLRLLRSAVKMKCRPPTTDRRQQEIFPVASPAPACYFVPPPDGRRPHDLTQNSSVDSPDVTPPNCRTTLAQEARTRNPLD